MRDGLFIGVIFYLISDLFFHVIFNFFPTGEVTDAAGRVGTALTSALHPGSGARPSQSPPSMGENGIFPAPEGKIELRGPTWMHWEGGW